MGWGLNVLLRKNHSYTVDSYSGKLCQKPWKLVFEIFHCINRDKMQSWVTSSVWMYIMHMQIILTLYWFMFIGCVGGSHVLVYERESECPSQWVGSVLLVLVQWARPCIRQVELQGEFCNTWPVSLSHLCGLRRERRKSREGLSEGRGGEGSASV